MICVILCCCQPISQRVTTGSGGSGILGAISLNVAILLGAFTKTFFTTDLNSLTSGFSERIVSATRCSPWAKQVTWIVFEYKIFNPPIASTMYGAASVQTSKILSSFIPEGHKRLRASLKKWQ